MREELQYCYHTLRLVTVFVYQKLFFLYKHMKLVYVVFIAFLNK